MRPTLGTLLAVSAAALGPPARGEPPAAPKRLADLDEARQIGWLLATQVVKTLEAGDQKGYPGIRAWLADYKAASAGIDADTDPAKWPPLDIDALTVKNPNFWRLYYEIAPADPGLTSLHGGLLLAGGEAVRASHVIVAAGQRPGVPMEVRQGLDAVLGHTQKVGRKPNAVVAEGIKLHDKKDYPGAVAKYREAIALWPQNGFAHYELGFTLREQVRAAAGENSLPLNIVEVNGGGKNPPETEAEFALARRHDPFQVMAYQVGDQAVIAGFMALAESGVPAWQEVVKKRPAGADDKTLRKLVVACQEAGYHELALVGRQVLVARRGGYAPEDHPFLTTSLRALAPGEQTEDVLKRLAGGELQVRQLVKPEPAKP